MKVYSFSQESSFSSFSQDFLSDISNLSLRLENLSISVNLNIARSKGSILYFSYRVSHNLNHGAVGIAVPTFEFLGLLLLINGAVGIDYIIICFILTCIFIEIY